jgi:hypothetical protein
MFTKEECESQEKITTNRGSFYPLIILIGDTITGSFPKGDILKRIGTESQSHLNIS